MKGKKSLNERELGVSITIYISFKGNLKGFFPLKGFLFPLKGFFPLKGLFFPIKEKKEKTKGKNVKNFHMGILLLEKWVVEAL